MISAAARWTEYVRDFERLTYVCFAGFWAGAEAGWTQRKNMDCQSFAQRFEALRPMLSSLGIDAAPKSAWNPLPLHRLAEIKKFFKGTVDGSNIRNAVNNSNA